MMAQRVAAVMTGFGAEVAVTTTLARFNAAWSSSNGRAAPPNSSATACARPAERLTMVRLRGRFAAKLRAA